MSVLDLKLHSFRPNARKTLARHRRRKTTNNAKWKIRIATFSIILLKWAIWRVFLSRNWSLVSFQSVSHSSGGNDGEAVVLCTISSRGSSLSVSSLVYAVDAGIAENMTRRYGNVPAATQPSAKLSENGYAEGWIEKSNLPILYSINNGHIRPLHAKALVARFHISACRRLNIHHCVGFSGLSDEL